MASQPGTLETLAQQVALALQPLKDRLADENVVAFFAELGLQFPPELLQPGLTAALNTTATAAGGLSPLLTQLATAIQNDDAAGTIQAGAQLLQQIGALIDSFDQIGTQLTAISGTLPGMNAAEVNGFAASLATRFLGYMLVAYLEDTQPAVVGLGNIVGVIDYLPNPGIDGDPTHPPFTLRQLDLGRVSDLLKSPAALLASLYDWGAGGFDGTKLIPRLAPSLRLLGIPATIKTPGPPNAIKAGLFDLAATPPGITITVNEVIPSGFDLTIPVSSTVSARIQAQGTFAAALLATLTPSANFRLRPPTGQLNGLLQLDLIVQGPDPAHPVVLFGQTGGSRLETGKLDFSAGLTIHFDATDSIAEPLLTFRATGGKLVIDTDSADGFVQTVLSGVHVEAGFDFTITWAPDVGVHFEGGAQLETTLPVHIDLGPVSISLLHITAGASTAGIPLELSAALAVTLGPFQATVDRLGVTGLLSFPASGGNLGPANLSAAFKPPSGLGVLIDAGVVAGGGFIDFFPDKGEYSGTFEVEIAEIIQVKVIAILDTKLPDGSTGFSFLLILTFDMPPIQLGFGFTLNGVGGLLGVNRTMSLDALHAGLRAHTLNSVLFPPDPIANAPQIISDVRSFFPPASGRYVFGPMLELGWGTPTLITMALGAILEVPDPVRLVIIGLINIGLPAADTALIEFHVDILGTIDFGTQKIAIDGSLYDSRVLIYPTSGDFALRLSWDADPNYLYSLGGFNPHFSTAGLDVPQLNRLSVSIGDGDNPRISSNSYFAVTSNTLQFGANTEAYASAAGFGIHGYLGFDVLIAYSPFSFTFDFKASFDVSFEGHNLTSLDVDGTFSGPNPWHLHAHASIEILWWSVGASFTIEWGDPTPAVLPQRPVLPDLVPALEDPRNWSTELPAGAKQAVSFVSAKPAAAVLRVHPVGTLSVRESVVPLDFAIARYGNAEPADGNLFSISGVAVNTHPETKDNFQDYFATAQFLDLNDADKLSRPSFERYDAGVRIGSATVLHGADSPRTVMYEERYVDTPSQPSRFGRNYFIAASTQAALSQQGAGFLSPARTTGLAKYGTGPAAPAVTTSDTAYVVAGIDDLAVRPDISSADGASYFQARAALSAHLASHPEDTEQLQIVPLHEVGP